MQPFLYIRRMKESGFLQVSPLKLNVNFSEKIALDWMLVTAGKDRINTMTASWGGTGHLWNKPVAFVFVRPERYTYEFMERTEGFTLSFFDERFRMALNICGSKSGRDVDKITEAGLTPVFTKKGYPAFSEASIILECRKLYANLLQTEAFIDKGILKTHYDKANGLHKMFIAKILAAWVK